jgi:hypothetical protein
MKLRSHAHRLGWLAFSILVFLISPAISTAARRVNAPYFGSAVRYPEAAVFWFGQVTDLQNYTDVRVGYTSQEIWINLAVFDRWLWEDDSPTRTPDSLQLWDAATLTLDTNSSPGAKPGTSSYRFIGALSWWRPRSDYQAAYRGTGTAWTAAAIPFTTETGWRGDAPNNTVEDRGWTITFTIPFSSLGLSGPPPSGTVWRLGVLSHDKDSQNQVAVSDKFWPEAFNRDQPSSWGELAFGLRSIQTQPQPPSAQTYTIRHKLNGITVADAMVGGSSVCGEGMDFFTQWGNANYAGSTHLVTQNQGDVADWPCFSKIYINFPLDALPPGKTVVSATMTVYQFGNSDPANAQTSLVQVLTVGNDWNESTITWNNAPLAQENVSQAWVDPLASTPPWPGAARSWDMTWAMLQAYTAGQAKLRLALYEADSAYHSGKYFTSSDTGDWNEMGRPTLVVILADSDDAPPSPPTNLRIVQ